MSITFQTTTAGFTALAAAYRGGGTKISFKRGVLASTAYTTTTAPSMYSINGVILEIRTGASSISIDVSFSTGAGKIKSILLSGIYTSQSTAVPLFQIATTDGVDFVPAQIPTVNQTITLSLVCPGANTYFNTETITD